MPAVKLRKTQISTGVIRQQRPLLDVATAAFSNAEDIARDLEPFLAQGLPEGATLPDMALFQVILGNLLQRHGDEMEAADEAHFAVLSQLGVLRLVRDDVSGRIFAKLVEIRDTFDAAFGVNASQKVLGVGVHMPEDPLTVRRLGDRVLLRLRAEDFALPPKRSEGVAVQPEEWVSELAPDLDALRRTLVEVAEAKRESQRTLEVKTAALDTYKSTYSRCINMLATLYRLAGRDHLADRLKPFVPGPRPSAKEDETDDAKADSEPPADADDDVRALLAAAPEPDADESAPAET